MRPVPRPQDAAVGAKNCATSASHEAGVTPAEFATPAPALPSVTPPFVSLAEVSRAECGPAYGSAEAGAYWESGSADARKSSIRDLSLIHI